MGSLLTWVGGTFGVIAFLLIGIIQIYAGYLGIEYHLGSGWAIGVVLATLFLRLPIFLTIGTFFGALDVWGWPWYGAAAFAMPGLLFVAPGVVGVAVAGLINLFRGGSAPEYNSNYTYERNEEPIDVTPPKKKGTTKKKKAKKKKVKKKK